MHGYYNLTSMGTRGRTRGGPGRGREEGRDKGETKERESAA